MCLRSSPPIQVTGPTLQDMTAISDSDFSRNDERDDETCLRRCRL